MNTLLPNLNATPVAPSAPALRSSFQADPLPANQSPSFSSTLAKEVADRSPNDNASQVHSGQNAQSIQNAQNAQAQAAQNSQNADNAQTAQSAQDAADAAARQVDAKKDDKDADKAKADKDAAASDADKTSSELLALVAASGDAKVSAQQQAAAAQTLQMAAPVTAQVLPTDAHARGKGGDTAGIDADGKGKKTATLATSADALGAKAAGKDGKQAGKTDDAHSYKADAAASDKTAGNAKAGGDTDATAQKSGAGAAATAVLNAKAGPHLPSAQNAQALNANAALNPALQQIANVASPAGSAAAAAADKLTPTVGTTDWNSALGQKMVWMSNNDQQSATLTLNPRDLGPLQVVINIDKGQADASFIASTPEVKHALEAAMPKLREMMDQAGIQLGQASVSTGMPQQQQAFNQPQRSGGHGHGGRNHERGGDSAGVSGAVPAVSNAGGSSGLGLVDTFV